VVERFAVILVMRKLFWREQIQERDIDTLKRQLREKLGGYMVMLSYITTENLLFRGVVCGDQPKTIDRISYPPPNKVTKLGRLNRIGQPMFYSSRGAPAVFYELQAKAGQRIALSTWELIEPLWMHNLGFHGDSLRRIGARIVGPRLRLTDPIPNETKTNAALRRQLSEAFTEKVDDGQEYRYKLSIAINELLFGDAEPLATNIPDGPRCDRAVGTVYPAMQMRGAADNVGIWPEFVDRYMRLKFVVYVLVEATDATKSSYTVSGIAESGEFSGKEIIWKDASTDPRLRRGHIALENGLWVQRDGLNQVYNIR
jgi:hypothetical protein